MPENRNVFEDIYSVVALIPPGRVSTYGAIARCLGIKNARTVGWAMNRLHDRPDVPAHRVVNSIGVLTGATAFKPDHPMHVMLENEGIKILKNRVKHMKEVFWDPSSEI